MSKHKGRKPRKRRGFVKPARQCWMHCGEMIEFRPTERAPQGAWVNAGTLEHHRCRPSLSQARQTYFGFAPTPGKEAYERLQRRFQPRIGGLDTRHPALLALRKHHLLSWFAMQPWSPTYEREHPRRLLPEGH